MSRTPAFGLPGSHSTPRRLNRLGQWWLDRSVPVKGLLALAIPMIALIGVSTSAFVLQLEERAERQTAIAASNITSPANVILQSATDAETRVRGYAATGDRSFYDGYGDNIDTAFARLDDLDGRVSTPAERARATEIRASLNALQAQLFTIIRAVGDRTTDSGLTNPLAMGRSIMDGLRSQIRELTAEPSAISAQKRVQINDLERRILTLQIIGLAVGLLTGAAGLTLFAYGIARRVTATAANAERLGAGRELTPTRPAKDELGRLDAAIADAQRLLSSRLEELVAARDQALTATHTKNSFLSRTSHELRTPLNAILGFAQLLEMSDLDDEDRESAEHIHQAGRHLLALINELIDISRVESGELQVSMEPISIGRVTQEVVSLVGPLAAARQITVRNLITDPAVAVYADYQRLKQVLVNLVSNAIKYNRHAGTITLDHRHPPGDIIELRVTDTGEGLDEADRERIWMPFERLDAHRGPIEGTGIGLPLARALAEAMHGTIEVESILGQGSTFTIRMVAATDVAAATSIAADPPALPAPRRSSPAGRRLTVLSIEDNMANSHVLDRIFRTWSDVSLIATDNAEDGLTLAGHQRPDLILMDLHLPGMSGEEAIQCLRADPATAAIPVVVLSADATPGTVRRLLSHGVSAYLTKPLDLPSLYQVLEDVTQRSAGLPPLALPSRGPVAT